MEPGALYLGGGKVSFTVWAPGRRSVEVIVEAAGEHEEPAGSRPPATRPTALAKDDRGYWSGTIANLPPGTRYRYLLDGKTDRPDPASHFQPEGVHGPSAVVDHGSFRWDEGNWRGLALEQMVLYELHVGTFSPEGTFRAVIPRLPDLAALGVTAIELMPVAQFPGERNWGYDGVYPYAVQASYGGPDGLKELVAACHRYGLAVVLDVVYNHLGPEGNYVRDFGPYFTDRYRTPWGEAINFDGPWSDEVREYFVGSALHWFRRYRIDALRLDAIHAIYDFSAVPFLRELGARSEELSRQLGRPLILIAESDLNDSRIVRSPAAGGLGMHAQWSDDLHHALHALLTGEREGYYRDFGTFGDVAKAYRDRFVYDGRYSPHRRRRHGNQAADLPPARFVVFSQNHDQVGNRVLGERTSALLPFEALRLLAASVLLSPYVPLLFMGEEYGEPSPFQYFVSHSDPELVEAVRQGRRREFEAFAWKADPPDPQDPATRNAGVLRWELRSEGRHRRLLELYTELLALRRRHPALGTLPSAGGRTNGDAAGGPTGGDSEPSGSSAALFKVEAAVPAEAKVLVLHRRSSPGETVREDAASGDGRQGSPPGDGLLASEPPAGPPVGRPGSEALAILSFSSEKQAVKIAVPEGEWRLLLDSEEDRWGGRGSRLPTTITAAGELPLPLDLSGYAFAVYASLPKDEP